MPPKPKNTKEAMIQSALSIVRQAGPEALTARNLGKQLHASPSTIFTHFASMEQVLNETVEAAREIYETYVQRGLGLTPPFKGFALEVIHFAAEEPKLFALLFMNPGDADNIGDVLGMEGHNAQILEAVTRTFQLDTEKAGKLYHDLWIYCHGIATLTATGVCSFSDKELSRMLGHACRGFLLVLQAPEDDRTGIVPQPGAQIPGDRETYFQMTGGGDS